MLTGESRFRLNTPLGIEPWVPHDGKQTGGPLDQWNCVWMQWDCRRSTGLPPPPQQPTMSVVKPEGGPAASVKLGQKSCVRSSGIITLSARWPCGGFGRSRLRRGHNDKSRRGHQCSKTTLTGESWFHKSTPLGIEPESLMTGSKQVDH